MALNRNKLYIILFLACMVAYIWYYINLTKVAIYNQTINVCLIKHLTNIPCPSCGSTRSLISLSKGHFLEALLINPFGYIIAIIMLVAPVWLTLDITSRRNTLYKYYQKLEAYISRPIYAIPLTLLVIMNWVWNITKEL